MKRFFSWLLDYLLFCFGSNNRGMATPFTIGVTSDVGLVASFLAKCVEAGLDWYKVENSPEMIQARANVAKQIEKDKVNADIAKAHQTHDLSEINKDAST